MDPNYLPTETSSGMGGQLIDFIQTLVVFLAIFLVIFLFVAQPHRVAGLSMYSTFDDGDYIITDKLTYRFSQPKRGDVVVFQNPRDHSTDFIKRIISLPGERVKIKDSQIYINDRPLDEPYLKPGSKTIGSSFLNNNTEITVLPNEYFALGDNRLQSSDSREWGFVRRDEILGRVLLRYWPPKMLGILPGAYAAYNF